MTQPCLIWTLDARDLLPNSDEVASVPTAITSVLPATATITPRASLKQTFLSAELGYAVRRSSLLGARVPAKAHLAIISPSAAQGHAEPITAFPQRLKMNQLDKTTIKLIAEFFWSQLFSLFREACEKVHETLFNEPIFRLLSNPSSSCMVASCQEASAIMHTLLWQHLKIAKLTWHNQPYKTHLISCTSGTAHIELHKIQKETHRKGEWESITLHWESFTPKDKETQHIWEEIFPKVKKITVIKPRFSYRNLPCRAMYFVIPATFWNHHSKRCDVYLWSF